MRQAKQVLFNRSGYSLVEVLISSMIVLVAIAAVVVIISRGSKINMDDLLRRRAYQVMEEVLERPDMSYKNYTNLQALIGSGGDGKYIVQTLPQVDLHKSGNDLITGTVQRRLQRTRLTYAGIQIPCIVVTVKVSYQNRADSLSTIMTSDAP